MDDCIFCMIAAGEIPSNVVCENELAMAFHDLNPMAPVHVLVIPKAHHNNIADNVDEKTLVAMKDCAVQVAEQTGILESGFRILTNTGDDSGQTVHHLHWHVLGGKRLSDQLA